MSVHKIMKKLIYSGRLYQTKIRFVERPGPRRGYSTAFSILQVDPSWRRIKILEYYLLIGQSTQFTNDQALIDIHLLWLLG